MHAKMLPKIHFYFKFLLLCYSERIIGSFNYFSKHNNGITNYTVEYFPFFKEYEPTCN